MFAAPVRTFLACELLVEARDDGGAVERFVSCSLPGDNWKAQEVGLSVGDRAYLSRLGACVVQCRRCGRACRRGPVDDARRRRNVPLVIESAFVGPCCSCWAAGSAVADRRSPQVPRAPGQSRIRADR